MNTFVRSIPVALLTSCLAFGGPIPQSNQRSAPTKLARFALGAYLNKDRTRLVVNVDKQLGGQVDIQFKDAKGNVLYEQMMDATDTAVRVKLNLDALNDGHYALKVTNGLEMIVRDVTIATAYPSEASRSITVLQSQ